jgi:Na+/citrate or Na+/malate symporter
MNFSSGSRQVGKSIIAVVAGAIVGIIFSVSSDGVLHLLGLLPPLGQPAGDGPLMLATAYRTAYGVAGAYITARLAPYRPMFHALSLGGLGMLASIVGAAATWNRMDAFGPRWYPVALIVLAIPTAWAGGRLFVVRTRANASA